MLTIGLAIRSFAKGLIGPGTESPVSVTAHLVDINRASATELQLLPGFGPSRAESVVLERVRHGPFRDAGELQRVDGIGPGIVDQLAPFLRQPARSAAGPVR